MAHKFSLNFKQSWITRRGANLIPDGTKGRRGKFHHGSKKCYEYVIKDRDDTTLEDVQLVPIQHVQVKSLYGPATILSSRQIVYPCSRGRCTVPCPCLICRKIHPRCRAGQSCGCKDCRRHFKDHSFHAVLHSGCKFCHNIIKTLPTFNFVFLDSVRKIRNRGVYKEEELEPSFILPPDLRRDMTSKFLTINNWPEKLKNWHCGVKDDGIWCFSCSTMFFSIDMLKDHILSNHNTAKVFRHNYVNVNEQPDPKLQCDHCLKTFGSRSDLTRHIESVHYQEHFECQSCDLTFTRKDNLEIHREKQHQKTCNICETCGKKFKYHSDLFRHSEEAKCSTLKCEICQKTFSRPRDLQRHRRDSCNYEKKVYVLNCDRCETTFIRTSDLVRHQKKRDNSDGSAKFVCSTCDKRLCNPKLLMAHIKTKHGGYMKYLETTESSSQPEVSSDKEKVGKTEIYGCEFCGKQFSREDSVLKHKMTHNISEKLKCEHCTTEFSLKKSLKRHQKESLDEAGDIRHKCNICDKRCCTGKMLMAHLNSMHKEFCCSVCKQIFSFKHHLERHNKNRNSFTCEDCGKHFCHKKGFSEHICVIHPKSLN